MEFDRNQFIANHGIVFSVTRFSITPSDRSGLRTLHFGEAKSAHFEVSSLLVELYDKMLAKDLPCVMMVGISSPLTRKQGDLLNDQRMSIANVTAGIFMAAGSKVPVIGLAVGPAAGYFGRELVKGKLPTYHAGDIIVSLDAKVSGGIGPQRSVSSMIIKSQGT
ncbi:hypothetical protein [Pseudomonas sp. FP1740]|uniref:hypothetical protein n=1 Tax=Pseudomonas sp. FP1740 TaxID=2954078 RepID=UPI0027347863|nr:hypothetical protein [Pseudomonas sp. FP1740]WLG45839.1 hypothetical protein PSH69_04185 [Pseudomonas sp. FP1740]